MSRIEPPVPGAKLKAHRSFGRLARKSVMWAYLRTGIYGIVAIPTTILLARMLSPADFGIAAAAMFFGQLAKKLSSGGLGLALVRVKDLRADHISSVFVISVVTSVAGALALVGAAPYIGAFYNAPEVGWVLPLVALSFLFGGLSMVQQALLGRDLRYREMATIGVLDLVVASLTAVVFAAFGFRYWSLIIGEVCGAFVKWIYGAWVVGWHLRFRFVPSAARELSSFALGSYTKGVLQHVTRNVDTIMIGRLLGVTPLGFYDKAYALVSRVFNKMMVAGPSVSFRIFSIIQDEPERFRRAYRKVIMTVTLFGYMVLGALAMMGPHLIVVAFGEKWGPSIVPLQILCAAFALRLTSQYAISAANARGWIWPLVGCRAVETVCIVAGIYVGSAWGINGVALAVLGATAMVFLLMQSLMKAATGLRWSDILEPQVPALSSTALLVVMLWGLDRVLASSSVIPPAILVVQACAMGVFALIFAWWCPFREARELMHEVVSDMSPRVAQFVWRDVPAARPAAVPAPPEDAPSLPSSSIVP
jgi:teichuronic acid exporter